MKNKKILGVLLAGCMMAVGLAGCTGGQPSDPQGTASPSPSPTPTSTATATVKPTDSDTIVMGTNAEFPPFEFVTTENPLIDRYDGIDVAIALEIGKDLGKTVKIENMEFDSLLVALATGKIDFVAAGMTVKPERLENADFSDTYYLAKQVIIVKEGSDITSASDLESKAVGVVLGYTGDTIMTDDFPKAKLTRFKKGADAVMELINGKLDAVVIDSAPAQAFVDRNNGLTIVEDTDAFENEEYAIAVKKGNTELLEKINGTLERLKNDGTIDELGERYNSGVGE